MDLFVWPQRWHLASFDPDSLAVLAYVKFGGLPVNVRTDFSFFQAYQGGAPYVVQGLNVASGVNQIFEYFRKENYGIEYHLEGTELVRLNALMRFVETELKPAVYHLLFLDNHNFSEAVRKAYCESVTFPGSLLLASRLQARAELRVKKLHLYTDMLDEEDLEKQIYDQAKVCLTSLSYLLGNNNFFVGDKPTAIDAVAFGLIFPLLKIPLSHNPLLHHLRQCENLSRFCFRLQSRLFAELTVGSNESNAVEPNGLAPALSFTGIRNTALFGAAVAGASLLFAAANGMVEFGVRGASDPDQSADRLTLED